MRIELISTGNELLTGDITDTNASWLAQQLTESGFKLRRKTTIADDLEQLAQAFVERASCADFIIVNGGLGPTSDDLSAAAAGIALNEPLQLFDAWLQQIRIKFSRMQRTMHDSNIKQAMLPKSAEIIDNPVGTACGFYIELSGCGLLFTPGVPREFKVMVEQQVLPKLIERSQLSQVPHSALRIERYLCFSIGESALAQRLEPLSLPNGVELAYRAAMPFIELKVFADQTINIDSLLQQIERIIAEFCVVKQGNSLSLHVHQLLANAAQPQGLKFAAVESCTGGLVSDSLIQYSGSSAYLDRGLVTYSNHAKTQLAAVNDATIERYGAVSCEVAQQMAEGALHKWQLDLTVAITGVAGPTGGSEHKPVGTVAFALATAESCQTQLLYFPNRGRDAIRQLATAVALDMVRRYLIGLPAAADYASFSGKRID